MTAICARTPWAAHKPDPFWPTEYRLGQISSDKHERRRRQRFLWLLARTGPVYMWAPWAKQDDSRGPECSWALKAMYLDAGYRSPRNLSVFLVSLRGDVRLSEDDEGRLGFHWQWDADAAVVGPVNTNDGSRT